MPIIDVSNREVLPPAVTDAIEQLTASLIGYLYTEHNDEGSHTDVEADSVLIREDGSLTLPNGDVLEEDATGGTEWRTEGGTALVTVGQRADSLTPRVVLHADTEFERRILLGDVTTLGDPSPGDWTWGAGTDGASTSDNGLIKTLYRAALTGNANVAGFYKPLPESVRPTGAGHLIVVWNDSAYTLTLDDAFDFGGTGASGQAFIINGPVVLGPQGSAILVYEAGYDWPGGSGFGGWRIVSVYHGQKRAQPYAPTWNSGGTQPDLGSGGSVLGTFTRDGNWIEFDVALTLGTGFSFGTGTTGLTLPSTPTGTGVNYWATNYHDVSVGHYTGVSQLETLNGAPCATLQVIGTPSSAATATSPFTAVAGDAYYIRGRYREA